jgi:type 1 glutamine amidotransferase
MARTAVLLALALLGACGDNASEDLDDGGPPDARPLGHIELHIDGQPGKPRVLIYTFENYWRHASNLDCRAQIANMNATRGFDISITNDPLAINATNLEGMDVIVFAITSGEGLNSLGRADLEAWIRAGGGVVGFHSASATEQNWPFYTSDVTGTQFFGHVDGLYEATVKMTAPTHPITVGLPDLTFADEWYMFTQRPETITGATPLMTLDEDTLPASYPAMYKQGVHTIAWAREQGPSRMFYAGWGHVPATWYDPTILELTGRAIEWAAHQR